MSAETTALDTFTAYIVANYPAGCRISSPEWHAPRLLRAAQDAMDRDLTSRSHECRECRSGRRKPVGHCADCCGTGIEGTGLRRRVAALTRELQSHNESSFAPHTSAPEAQG